MLTLDMYTSYGMQYVCMYMYMWMSTEYNGALVCDMHMSIYSKHLTTVVF